MLFYKTNAMMYHNITHDENNKNYLKFLKETPCIFMITAEKGVKIIWGVDGPDITELFVFNDAINTRDMEYDKIYTKNNRIKTKRALEKNNGITTISDIEDDVKNIVNRYLLKK